MLHHRTKDGGGFRLTRGPDVIDLRFRDSRRGSVLVSIDADEDWCIELVRDDNRDEPDSRLTTPPRSG